eukprot:5842715-Prymnesium_polylepis.2
MQEPQARRVPIKVSRDFEHGFRLLGGHCRRLRLGRHDTFRTLRSLCDRFLPAKGWYPLAQAQAAAN